MNENEKKQIEEMAKDICHSPNCDIKKNGSACYKYCKAYIYAFRAVNAGYRKQSEGEWIDADPNGHLYRFTCSLCGRTKLGRETPYCPNCGAKMKGGERE